MRPFLDDLRSAFRSLRQRPAFTTVVVLTLAIALGANTAVFSVLEQTLLRPLPFDGVERLVYLFRVNPEGSFRVTPSGDQVRAWAEGAETLASVESFGSTTVALLHRGEPRGLDAVRVSPGLFTLLGVRPILGPGLAAGETEDGARRVVLSHRLWRELFEGSPRALGAPLRLDDGVYTVAGVVGPELRSLPPIGEVDLWLPFEAAFDPSQTSDFALAALAPGATAAAAEEEIVALEAHRAGEQALASWRPVVLRPAQLFGAFLGRQLLVLQASVALLLLVGCANIGNLFLVRAAGRRRELAIRSALGAGRGRVARVLVLESLLVAATGALAGLLLALWGGRVLTRLRDWPFIELDGVRLDAGLFAFTAAAALVAALAFGLVPAWSGSRSDPGVALRTAAPGAGNGAGRRALSTLVVAEIAISLVLLVGAGLLTRHFLALLHTLPGFDPEGVVALTAHLPDSRYASTESRTSFLRDLGENLEGLAHPGVEIALASSAPPEGGISFGALRAEGATEPRSSEPDQWVASVSVGPGYFRTLGLPILEGRPLERDDLVAGGTEGETPVVINRGLAGHLWSDGGAVGRRFRIGSPDDPDWYRVAGVAADASLLGLRGGLPFQIYSPLRDGSQFAVLVRSSEAERDAVVDRVTARVRALDPALPFVSVETVERLLADDLAGPRFQAALMLSFAGIALALAGLGVYAVLAFSVRRRSFEIGVRSALGARPGQVLALIGRQGAALVLAGVVLGTAGAWAAARLLGNLLGEVPPHDPAVYVVAGAVLLAACAAAILIPAARAARLDPVRVLRRE